MKTIEDFKKDCNKKKCNRGTLISSKCSKDYKQERCYKKYVEKCGEPRELKEDKEWVKCREEVISRDKGECQFLKCLSVTEHYEFMKSADISLVTIIDPAHVFGKGSSPKLKYTPENVVLVNREVHSLLDTHRDPITGNFITPEQIEKWWERIVGKERLNLLKEMQKQVTIIDRYK